MSFFTLTSGWAGKAATKSPWRVLVAGAMDPTQNALRAVLERCGVSVPCCNTPSEIRVGLEHEPCSLLIVCLDDEQDERFELVRQAKTICPSTPILALVNPGDVPLAVRVMKAGATNCLETSAKTSTLQSAVRELLEPCRAGEPSAGLNLSPTESLVLAYILDGRTTREIAYALHRSHRTIEVHRRTIMRKLGVSSVVDLIKRAMSLHLTPVAPPGRQEDARLVEA